MKYKVFDKEQGRFLNWNEAFVSQAGNVFLVKNIEDQDKLTLSLIRTNQDNYSVEEIEDAPETQEPEVKYRGSIKNCIKMYGEQVFDNARIRLCLDESGLIKRSDKPVDLDFLSFVHSDKRDVIYTTKMNDPFTVKISPQYNALCDKLILEEEIELLW